MNSISRVVTLKMISALILLGSSKVFADPEVTKLEEVTVVEDGQLRSRLPDPEEASTSTLETDPSEIELSVDELKGVAGSQGDPLQAINTLPGIATATGGQGRPAGFYVRGSNANDNLIWIDGLPVGYIFHLGGRFSVINPDLIENFQTYLGGFGVEYGDRMGGVVSVNTRAPYNDRLHQSYQVGFYDSSARIEGPVGENGSAFFAIRRSYIDLLLPATGKIGDSDNTYTQFPEFWDMQARYRHDLTKGFIDVSLFTSEDQLKFDIQDEEDISSDPALAGDLQSKQSFQTLGLRWHQQLTSDLTQKIRTGVMFNRNEFAIGTQQADDPNPGESFGVDSKSANYFLLPQWQWAASSTQDWKFGVDARQIHFDVDGYISSPCREGEPDCTITDADKSDLDQQETGYAVDPYVELTQQITSLWLATLGVRDTHISVGETELSGVSPRLNLEYQLNERTVLTGAWGRYLQMPQGYEMIDGIGNPDLVMTESEHRIIGVKYRLSSAWSAQVEAYHKPMKKLVVSRDPPENYANEGKGYAQGFDVLLKRQWRDRSYGWVTYSYLETEREDTADGDNRLFDGDQPHTLNVVWNQPLWGSWSNWMGGFNLKLHSGLPYTEVVGREGEALPDSGQTDQNCQSNGDEDGCYWSPVYGETNGERLPFYLTVDLGMERTWKFTDLDLTARFELLNVAGLFRPNVVAYKYDADYSNYDDPDEVTDFPFLPSFSIRATF